MSTVTGDKSRIYLVRSFLNNPAEGYRLDWRYLKICIEEMLLPDFDPSGTPPEQRDCIDTAELRHALQALERWEPLFTATYSLLEASAHLTRALEQMERATPHGLTPGDMPKAAQEALGGIFLQASFLSANALQAARLPKPPLDESSPAPT